MQTILQDIRYALRQARKTPGFTLIAVLTLALGVGAATAIFSVVDAVILRPLPYAQPERIFVPETLAKQGYTQPFSWLSFKDLKAQNHSFEAFSGVFDYDRVNMQTPSGPVSFPAVQGSDDFFRIFGVAPILGRTYLPGEDQPGKNDVVVLSYEVWQTNFGGRADVVGRTVQLDGRPYICIGVMPAGFRYPMSMRNAVYMPIHLPVWAQQGRGSHFLQTVARLKPGLTGQQAQAEMNALMANLGKAFPDTDGGRRMQLVPVGDSVNGDARKSVWTLAVAVLAVLLIGCLNVAGLLLARGVKREREMALRAAVGASRTRLIRQVLTESLLLAFFGAAGGIALAAALLAAMRVFLVQAMQRGADVSLNTTVLAAAVLLSVLTSVAASLAPALRLSGADPNRALKSGANAGTARGQHRVRSGFIITQVALSLVLLVVAGVLLRSVEADSHQELGFDPSHLLAVEINLSPARYQGRNLWTDFYQPLEERVQHLPGVRGAGLISLIPVQAYGSNQDIHIAGQPPYPPDQIDLAEMRFVTPGYFDAMGIRLMRGRMLSPSLDVSSNKAGTIVVNQAFVKKYIPAGLDPALQHLDDSDDLAKKTAIVGEVTGLRQKLGQPSMPEMDWLITELSTSDMDSMLMSDNLIVRTAGDPKAQIPAIRAILHDLDPTAPVRAPETMDEVIADQLVMERMATWLFGIFAALALLLAVIGLYGLISHEVEMSTRDIGVRMALGATRGSVLEMILRRVVVLLVIGVGGGLVLAYAAKQLIASVTVIDFSHQAPLLAALAAAMVVVGLAAALLPARRAASIEPMTALRTE